MTLALKDIHKTGTIANILQILKLTDGTMKVLVEGLQRAELVNLVAAPRLSTRLTSS